ncbi:hypothetical protein [Methylocystis sp.]|uniref:hypothetical protein n=1 Tax=Methylocystis sp. TaxID=1911079 RepID=UPI003D12EF3C
MSGTPLSDWTPIAYFQREEERRRNEQKAAEAAPPEQEARNNDEKHLGGVTVASLQRRFVLLEQRLAILEQREHERQIREKHDAASMQAQSVTAAAGVAYLGEELSVRQGEDHSKARSRPEFTYSKVEQAEPVDDRKTCDLPPQSHASDSWREKSSETPSEFVETHPLRSGEPFQAEPARRMAQTFYSFVVTAFLAGSIGFLGAILIVPAEKALKFHAFVNIAVKALTEASRTK